MPSERVVFDMVILEALASGLPIIASDEGGNREIISDGKNGYLLKNNSAKHIAIVISTIIDKRKEINTNLLPYWATKKNFLKQYEMLYER